MQRIQFRPVLPFTWSNKIFVVWKMRAHYLVKYKRNSATITTQLLSRDLNKRVKDPCQLLSCAESTVLLTDSSNFNALFQTEHENEIFPCRYIQAIQLKKATIIVTLQKSLGL